MSVWRPIPKESFLCRHLPWWLYQTLFYTFRITLLGVFTLLAIVLTYCYLASKFDLSEVRQLPNEDVYLDRLGKPLGEAGSQKSLLQRDDIPPFFVEALLSREDLDFFDHKGVDFKGLLRATLRNIKDRKFTQGGSTLSMQLTRNVFDLHGESLHRKCLEIALTLRVEFAYSKDEILTNYLNRIYFGAGAYGLNAAAVEYFGKRAADLSDAESAMLVGIIRGPHIFCPKRDLDAAKQQQRQTLRRMVVAQFIDQVESTRIAAEPIVLVDDESNTGENEIAFAEIEAELNRVLPKNYATGSGLRVFTTFQLGWQSKVRAAISEALLKFENKAGYTAPKYMDYRQGDPLYLQFAVMSIDTETGAVFAKIKSRDIQHSTYDRTRSKRDMGRVIEPFIALAAADREKLIFKNRPLLTGRQLGIKETIRLLKRQGFSGSFLETEDLYRGGMAATLKEVATALAIIGHEGKEPKSHLIAKIEDRSGTVIYRAAVQSEQKFAVRSAKEAKRLFQKRGSGRYLTGSTGSGRDLWIFRYGPTGSTVIWIGFDQPTRVGSHQEIYELLRNCVENIER